MRRALLLTFAFAACGGETSETEPAADGVDEATATGAEPGTAEPAVPAGVVMDPREVEWNPSLEVDLDAMEQQASGLYIQMLQLGDGPEATGGDQMGMHYTVWLADGSKLDSSFDHTPPEPLGMVLGETPLIDGWTEGVTGMKLGGKRRLVVPYDLGYGASGRPGVPPYSALLFEVELAEHTPASD